MAQDHTHLHASSRGVTDISGRLAAGGFDGKEHAVVLDLSHADALAELSEAVATIRNNFFRVYGFSFGNDTPCQKDNALANQFNFVAVIAPSAANAKPCRESFMDATRQFNQIYPWQDFTFFSADPDSRTAAQAAGWKTRAIPQDGDAARVILDTLKIR